MTWWRRETDDDQPELDELAAQVQRSDEQADQALADAHTIASHAYAVASRLDRLTAANGFGDWVLRRVAAARREGER
ncbi:DUF7620 family protein [Streptosporangium sp. DT93]|uniref:DUF7620 family protein n=1 Tax=Streptosporangium sp. DT93 TaxID=3393428 RepID=UPI003CED059C